MGLLTVWLTPMDEYCRTNAEVASASWDGMLAQCSEDKAARKPWWEKVWDSTFGTSAQMVSIFAPFAVGAKNRKVRFDAESAFTQRIREHGSTKEFRDDVREYLRNGKPLSDLRDGGYKAGGFSPENLNLWRDALTVTGQAGGPFNPLIPGENRVLVSLGTYDLTAKTVVQTGPNSAVVRFSATNNTTLGSLLRIGNDDFYRWLNDLAGTSGPYSKYTETFVWEETVTW